jgi:glutathione synthase/RimK-type ligase-like ATP-grasp enzyme
MRHDVKPPEEVREVAKKAVKSLGYLYGAVDLAVDGQGKVWVFEVNSAPGMDTQTMEAYVKAIKRWAGVME